MKYAIALGYGLFDKSKEGYRNYLDNFVEFVNQNNTDIVVLSGGHTNPERMSESEASTMRNYIKPLIRDSVKILLEDKALSTTQNIRFLKKFIRFEKKDEVVLFCDNVRSPKIMWFVLHYWFDLSKTKVEEYFLDYSLKFYKKHYTTEEIGKEMYKGLKYKNVTVKPYPLRTKIDEAISNQISTVIEILSLYDKGLDKKIIKAVKIRQGLSK